MSEFATRASFLTNCQRRYGTCTLPFSGMAVRYQSLTEGEQSKYEMDVFERDSSGMLLRDEQGNLVRDELAMARDRSRLIVACVVDGDGNRLLTDADLAIVDGMDGGDSRFLTQALREHCGIIPRQEAKKNDSPPSTTSASSHESSSTTS